MSVKSNPEYYRLSPVDRVLCLSGIPIQYLQRTFQAPNLRFQAVTHQVEKDGKVIILSAQSQKNFYNQLESHPEALGCASHYVIAAQPTIESAYLIAVHVSRTYYLQRLKEAKMPKVQWIDLGGPPWPLLRGEMEKPELAVIHGLGSNSEPKRLEMAKDFIRAVSGATTLIIADSQNGLEFAATRLSLVPDGVLQLGRTVHRSII